MLLCAAYRSALLPVLVGAEPCRAECVVVSVLLVLLLPRRAAVGRPRPGRSDELRADGLELLGDGRLGGGSMSNVSSSCSGGCAGLSIIARAGTSSDSMSG